MSLLNNILSGGRLRACSKQVAQNPSAKNYARLANELARRGNYREVVRTCEEGLELNPNDPELTRLIRRVAAIEREGRMRELLSLLSSSPRPALWRETCDLLIESGRFPRAEEVATDWHKRTGDGEAVLYRARARSERFFADRRSEDGRVAYQLCLAARDQMPDDERVLRLRAKLGMRCGAWADLRKTLARLLELRPGDPSLEARFRTVIARGDETRTIEQALHDVEMTGLLEDDAPVEDRAEGNTSGVRPVLQKMTDGEGIQAAFFVRGGTALVQGPKGATAERCARAMRDMIQATRSAARRMGLGQATELMIEGDFGHVVCVPRETGSAALWADRTISSREQDLLRDLAGSSYSEAVH